MNKISKSYAILWAVSLAIFNVIVLILTNAITGLSSVDGAYWIGLVFINVAFIAQLAVSFYALNDENLTKVFYKLPMLMVSRTALVFDIIFGGICMIVPGIPEWLGFVLCFAVFGFSALSVLKAKVPANAVAQIDERVETQTYMIRALTNSSKTLMDQAKTAEIKAECKKVYEAFRFSDPMSNDLLSDIESQIVANYNEFSNAVLSDNISAVGVGSKNLLLLINDRNSKCKMLK